MSLQKGPKGFQKGHKWFPRTKMGDVKIGISHLKIKNPEQVTMSNKYAIRAEAKQYEVGRAIVDAHPELSWANFDAEKFVQVRAEFVNFLNQNTAKEINEKRWINNILNELGGDFLVRLMDALKKGKKLDKFDLERADTLLDHLFRLDKLKHGDKHVSVNYDIKYIQDLNDYSRN